MANIRSIFTNFTSIFFILLHLGCFITFPTSRHHRHRPKPPRKPPSLAPFRRTSSTKLKRHKFISSTVSFIKRIFSSQPKSPTRSEYYTRSIFTTRPGSLTEFDYSHIRHENYEIYPCPHCGEIFPTTELLDRHQSVKHAVYDLSNDDPGNNVVRIIFGSGWNPIYNPPTIHRVMKIYNTAKILARFEEYRETVKSRAARQSGPRWRDERCIADGNELLRFHCTTFICELGQNGNSRICTHPYCGVCGIIGSGFSPKLDGVSTLSNSWKAHVAIPEDMEDEFRFMNVKRAMLVCRVIAGRVGCGTEIGDKDDLGYDSLVGRGVGVGPTKLDDEDELIVFNPRAVLPCFVIVYTV